MMKIVNMFYKNQINYQLMISSYVLVLMRHAKSDT